MNSYMFPDLSCYNIIFNGRRYKAFMISKGSPFQGYEDYAEFLVWDGVYDALVAYGNISADGEYEGFLAFSHIELDVNSASTISEFVKNTKKAQEWYFKATGA